MSYPIKAKCQVAPKGQPCHGGSDASNACTGIVNFLQTAKDVCKISWDIKNCGKEGDHGFHIHEKADFRLTGVGKCFETCNFYFRKILP